MLLQLGSIFLNVITPVFTVIIIGYAVAPRLRLETRTLSRYAYFILTPAFTFNIFSQAKVEAAQAARMIIFIIAVHVGCVILGFLVAWLLRRPREMIAAYVLIAVFGNVGNYGLPIIEFRLGTEALTAASLYFLVISTFAFVVGVAVANWHSGGGFRAAIAVFKTPAILAILPAILLNALQVEPPLFLARSISLLANAMIPTMLLALGLQLAGMGRPKLSLDVLLSSAVRLIGGPALALLLAIPFGMTGIEYGAGVFQASMPAAVLTTMIAMEHNLLPDFVTTTVLFSTVASVVTLTIILAIV